ncbi:hypothetical protein E0Z10_g9708 [Xylaria hypoxylon]|uniref:DUF6604 domain-containing protein n=1 Tax=Xylaria hypoxylon TaxID=37992 RepID=A0A4Z0YGH9_9PEZI|nr:hypothetical protein E0Z10_g9708 [Xylaria hypoxylon]
MNFNSNTTLYPKYKKDTKTVAQWLDTTSKAYGFISSRRGQQPAGAKETYTIGIADFGHMAEFLLHKEHVSIPSYIWTSLSRAIRYRSTYGSYLQLRRQDEAKDKNHLFFIDVLRNVQSVLSRISKPAATVNTSAGLYVPQPATVEDDVEDHTSIPIRTKVPPEPTQDGVIFQPWEEDDEEALFQWRLFNVDVQRLRKQIRQLWELYRTGHLNLAGVAIAHNMAIHMVRKMEQDIHPVFERWGGYANLSMAHFVQRYVGTAVDVEEANARLDRLHSKEGITNAPTVKAIIDGFDIAEEEMLFAWQALGSETWTWRQCGSYGSYNGKWGPFRPRDDRQNMTNLEKYNQDKAVACQVVLDVQILAIFLNSSLGMKLDELSTAIEDIVPWGWQDLKYSHKKFLPCDTKHSHKNFLPWDTKITFRAVFATQLLLDSIHVLGTSVDRPSKELLDKTARIFKSAKGLREFYEGHGALALGSLPGPSYVESIERTAKFWQREDPIAEFRRHMANPPKPAAEKVSALLKHNAPLCGWWMQIVQAASYPLSIMIANSISLPMACARLYFAFVQEGLVPTGSWPDMDAFSTLHRGDLWVGTAPKSGQYLKNLMLAGGNSIVNLASDARSLSQPIRHERVKFLTPSLKVSERILDAFVDRKVEGLSEEDLERLMTDTKLRWYNGKAVRPCFHHGWDKVGGRKEDNPTSSDTYNPFLRLAQAIDAETLEQSFDYMSLNRVCWMVLRELIKKGRPILDAIGSPHSVKPAWEGVEGQNARSVVGFIFLMLFLPDGTVHRQGASAIADILLNLTKALGRIVHTSTGINWDQALKCTCADIPS